MLGTILLIILILILIGALPRWPYSTGWGLLPQRRRGPNPDYRRGPVADGTSLNLRFGLPVVARPVNSGAECSGAAMRW
jgi:hypothetical protein